MFSGYVNVFKVYAFSTSHTLSLFGGWFVFGDKTLILYRSPTCSFYLDYMLFVSVLWSRISSTKYLCIHCMFTSWGSYSHTMNCMISMLLSIWRLGTTDQFNYSVIHMYVYTFYFSLLINWMKTNENNTFWCNQILKYHLFSTHGIWHCKQIGTLLSWNIVI